MGKTDSYFQTAIEKNSRRNSRKPSCHGPSLANVFHPHGHLLLSFLHLSSFSPLSHLFTPWKLKKKAIHHRSSSLHRWSWHPKVRRRRASSRRRPPKARITLSYNLGFLLNLGDHQIRSSRPRDLRRLPVDVFLEIYALRLMSLYQLYYC
ncbi:uncharacterized protein LOC120259992 [Dioscorea cayenensis subsp. rotundata]|uniref:Uncharacterized protein LOC120259992 n=1 Tax=Dioscorea cayennensis subsp. rotundata TaxID=55577 RepID=A0AB40B7V7_DIOCR|nr:uncharacterized protein LOC120259992 [Dioscorea cayenensis subsp. rotundata]